MFFNWISMKNLRHFPCRGFFFFIIVSVFALCSCIPRVSGRGSQIEFPPRFPVIVNIPPGNDVSIRGKLRAELPKYRVKGILQIYCSHKGSIRLDFHHSSFMGAYEESYTLLVSGGTIYLYDRVREMLYRGEEVLELLSNALGTHVYVEDLPVVLLFKESISVKGESFSSKRMVSEWKVEGTFKGRDIIIKGARYVEAIEQCIDKKCYIARYLRYKDSGTFVYPFYIILTKKPGTEKVTFEVSNVEIVGHVDERFTLDGMIFSYGVIRRDCNMWIVN